VIRQDKGEESALRGTGLEYSDNSVSLREGEKLAEQKQEKRKEGREDLC